MESRAAAIAELEQLFVAPVKRLGMAFTMERVNPKIVAAFAEVLASRRRAAGLTQEALAERADVSARHVSLLETARRQPSLTTLQALSRGLNIPLGTLAGEVEALYMAGREADRN